MSFCHFSPDSELSCYEDEHGRYVTAVGTVRHAVPPIDRHCRTTLMKSYKRRLLERGKTGPIGLPYDGEVYYDISLQDMMRRVANLAVVGYRVPASALKAMNDEAIALEIFRQSEIRNDWKYTEKRPSRAGWFYGRRSDNQTRT